MSFMLSLHCLRKANFGLKDQSEGYQHWHLIYCAGGRFFIKITIFQSYYDFEAGDILK